MSNKITLRDFTRGFSSGITLLRTFVRSILPNLYVINEEPSTERTRLIYDGDYPDIKPHAYGESLDLLGDMFGVSRNIGEEDSEFRRRILFSVGQSPTREGIARSMVRLFDTYGVDVDVEINESIHDFCDGTSNNFDSPMRDPHGSMLFGVSVTIKPALVEGSKPVFDEDGFVLYNKVDIFNRMTFEKEEFVYPVAASWPRYKNIYISKLIESFRVPSLKFILEDIIASGIRIDRVVIVEPGTGGSKGRIV